MTIRDTSVCYFDSTMAGAPTLNGLAGSMISVLDACLLDGFGSVSVTSLTVTTGVATLTVNAGHGLVNLGASASVDIGVVILIGGVSAPRDGLNTRWRASVTSPTVLTWTCGSTIPDGSAQGVITVQRAPTTGWSRVFSGTNRAAYRSLDAAATGLYLRVEDAGSNATEGARVARVVGYEAMSDIDTGTAPFPTAAQQAGGLRWIKSYTADGVSRFWAILADHRTVYLWVNCGAVVAAGRGRFTFGDCSSFVTGDVSNFILSGNLAALVGGYYSMVCRERAMPGSASAHYVARSYVQSGGPVYLHYLTPYAGGGNVGQGLLADPCLSDGRTWVAPLCGGESTVLPRGTYRGLFELLSVYQVRTWLTPYVDVSGAPATLLLMAGGHADPAHAGDVLADVVGPWS